MAACAVAGTDRPHPTRRWSRTRLTRRKARMPTYIMLSSLTPEGVQTVKNNPQRIREVNHEIEPPGASVRAQWATLGRFDFVNVVEAPDEGTMARVSLELGSRGTAKDRAAGRVTRGALIPA